MIKKEGKRGTGKKSKRKTAGIKLERSKTINDVADGTISTLLFPTRPLPLVSHTLYHR